MKPAPFTLHRPSTLDEALDVLAELGDDAKVLAGGQSLLPLLSMRLAAPAHLVDVNAVPGLATVEPSSAGVRVGALARHAQVLRDAGVTRTRADGTQRLVSLRLEELERRFPGLLGSVVDGARGLD